MASEMGATPGMVQNTMCMEYNHGTTGNCKQVPGKVPLSGGGQNPHRTAKRRPKKNGGASPSAYPPAVRLTAVRLHLEQGCTLDAIAKDLGVNRESVHNWVRQYRADGEAGLQAKARAPRAWKLAEAVRARVALLDGDRFEGKYREGVHTVNPADLVSAGGPLTSSGTLIARKKRAV